MNELLERVPPQDLSAEQAALGSMMLEAEALMAGLAILSADDFYRPAHTEVFAALQALASKNEPVDLITLQEELRRREKLQDCGGTEYLMALVESVPTAAHVEHYAKIVADKAESRRVISACSELIGACYDPETTHAADLFVTKALATTSRKTTEFHGIAEVAGWEADDLVKQDSGDRRESIPFGVPRLMQLCYGVEPESELTLIGGRPSSGKTLLLNQIAINTAKASKTAIFFSQETSVKRLVRRMAFSEAGVDAHLFRVKGFESEDEEREARERVFDALGRLYELEGRIQLCDISLPLSQLVPAARRAILRYKASVVLVDYLQIVGVDTKRRENRNTEVQEICRALKGLTQDTGVPVVAATQLSRPVKGTNHRPTLADLREGGSQEAEADKIVMLHYPDGAVEEVTYENGRAKPQRVEFVLAKNKDGPKGVVNAWFEPGRFVPEDTHDWATAEPKKQGRKGLFDRPTGGYWSD